MLGLLPAHKVLSLGVINGRNIWKTDLNAVLDWVEPLVKRLWIAPSCSLLHVPMDLSSEQKLDAEIKSWLAYALQKLDELRVLGKASPWPAHCRGRAGRQRCSSGCTPHIASRPQPRGASCGQADQRQSSYEARTPKQARLLKLPAFPITTIDSFPQTAEIRQARSEFKAGHLDFARYQGAMHAEIERCVQEQEALGLDVLVHGEAEHEARSASVLIAFTRTKTKRPPARVTYLVDFSEEIWRREPESNWSNRICNPGHNRFAIAPLSQKPGAGKRVRTVDLYLGKVSLYQLSYSRIQKALAS